MSLRNLVRDVARRALGTRDVANLVRRRRLALKKKFYRRPFSLQQTRELLTKLGFSRGRTVWVQSSWNEFYNLPSKPSDVINLMLDLLGPDGTLVMPAFPIDPDPDRVLDIDSVPSSTGLLTEIFRRHPGVTRSIHLTSSVCAHGPGADFLVRDHHRDLFPWGRLSPYCRLMELDARLVCLGLGRFVSNLTPLHAVECLLHGEIPFFTQIFDGTIKYRWRRRSGAEGKSEFYRRTGRLRMRGYGRHFPKSSFVEHRLSNLHAYAIDARLAIQHAVALGRSGITIYAEPRPRRELFERGVIARVSIASAHDNH